MEWLALAGIVCVIVGALVLTRDVPRSRGPHGGVEPNSGRVRVRSWLWLLIAALLGGAASLILTLVAHFWPQQLTEAEIAIVVTLSIFGTSYLVENWVKFKELEISFREIQAFIEQESVVRKSVDSLKNVHEFIRHIAEETIVAQIQSVQASPSGFNISGIDWAMRANSSFWRGLTPRARSERRRGIALTCFVVYSSDPRLWKEQEGYESLLEQKIFLEEGGEIECVFIGDYPFTEVTEAIRSTEYLPLDVFVRHVIGAQFFGDKPGTQDYADALTLMHLYGIKVYYAEAINGVPTEDFVTVSIGGRELTMRWMYAHRLGRVVRCVFEESTVEAKRYWDRLARNADPVARLFPSELDRPTRGRGRH